MIPAEQVIETTAIQKQMITEPFFDYQALPKSFIFESFGAGGGTRTHDLGIMRL